MRYRIFGGNRTGLKVSELAYGTTGMFGQTCGLRRTLKSERIIRVPYADAAQLQ